MMQLLTAAPRAEFTDAQILAAIAGDSVLYDAGVELLDRDLNVVKDISEDLALLGSQIAWSSDATPYITCQLGLSIELNWATDLIRIYRLLGDGKTVTKYYRGVFCLTTPGDDIGTDLTIYQVDGFDRLYLLSREVGNMWAVGAGYNYLRAIADVFVAAGLTGVYIDQTAADAVLPSSRTWPLISPSGAPTRYIDIVNALAAAINYDPVFTDETGEFQVQAHVETVERPAEFTFDADDETTTTVAASRSKVEDHHDAPNKWIFVQSGFNGTPTEGDGIYTVVNQSDGPLSIDERGYEWAKQFPIDAADQATLEALGNAKVADDMAATTTISFSSSIVPIAGHNDVVNYRDTAAGLDVKAIATAWVEPLDNSLMTWQIQAA